MKIHLSKEVPVIATYDVIVSGGGPSGFTSALAAARGGASVALIERYGFLGGMATAGLVSPLCEFCYNGKLVIGGIPWEFANRLVEAGGGKIEYPLGNIAFHPERYKLVMQRMLLEAGVTLYLHAFVTDCVKDEENRIAQVVMESKSGTEALSGRYFIDCTGDGDLAHRAGVSMQHLDRPLQPASLCFCMDGVEVESLEKVHHSEQGINYHVEPIQAQLRELAKTMEVPNFGGPWFMYMLTDHSVLVNMTRMEANMVDEREITKAECTLREDAFALVELLRKHVKGFEHASILETAPQVGVRETRRIQGVHILTGEEYARAEHFEDSIGRGAHPIDIHTASDSTQRCQFLEEAAYIPYRSLIAPDFPNLLVPGRSFSADREASASARVMASLMGLGQAAGFAAAQCAKDNLPVQQADIPRLRKTLLDEGANI